MTYLRIAGIQINTVVGDIDFNTTKILDYSDQAVQLGAQIIVFGELSLLGYPVEDLALHTSFIHQSTTAAHILAKDLAEAGLGHIPVIIGYLDSDHDGIHNAAAVLYSGEIVGKYWKYWLPNYGVFDEKRWFTPGGNLLTITINNHRLGVVICEDIWHNQGPIAAYAAIGVDGLLCLNASPFNRYQSSIRADIISTRVQQIQAPIYYVNIVGGQDELVFDGDSQFIGFDNGRIVPLKRAQQFVEEILLHDIPIAESITPVGEPLAPAPWKITNISINLPPQSWPPVPIQLPHNDNKYKIIWNALVLGTKDYIHKAGGSTVLLGLSGGIDSAVVAVLACDAFGAHNVYGIAMPSKYSSEGSIRDAEALAEATGLHLRCESIEKMVDVYISQLGLDGLAEENIQARCRGMLLMAISNQENHLVLATGNKSELAVGYSTIYGDAVGAYAPIRDVPKTLVYELANWRNSLSDAPIPVNSISKAPSAELRPNQQDNDSLPDYAILDAILEQYVDYDIDPLTISKELLLDQNEVLRICKLVDRAEFKRRQYPLGPKITTKSFGRDRRIPIINRWLHHNS